jgi:hypothetical protein
MASPAQVANDMEARAKVWAGHNRDVATAMQAAAWVIRAYLFGPVPDGRTVAGVLTRLYRLDGAVCGIGFADIRAALSRAADTIQQLRKEARDAVR